MEKFFNVFGFITLVVFQWCLPILDWVNKNPTLWTKQVGHLYWLLIISLLCLSPFIIKKLKQQ